MSKNKKNEEQKPLHALHWGYRIIGDCGIEVFGSIRIAGRIIHTNPTGSLKDAVISAAQELREQITSELERGPHRIYFADKDGFTSKEPCFPPHP